MTLLVRIFPSLLSVGYVLAFALSPAPPARPADTTAEVRALHQQMHDLRLRLGVLEASPPPAGVPRGIGIPPPQKE